MKTNIFEIRNDSGKNEIDLQLLIVADYFKLEPEELLSNDEIGKENKENLKIALEVLKELKTKSLDEVIEIKKVDKNLLLEYVLHYHHPIIRKAIPEISNNWKIYKNINLEANQAAESIHLLFSEMGKELVKHLEEEELHLIPVFEQFEDSNFLPSKKLCNYILVATSDHDETMGMTNEIMRKIDQISNDSPNDALLTYTSSVTKFIENLYEHIHIEQEILFPYYRGLTVKQ